MINKTLFIIYYILFTNICFSFGQTDKQNEKEMQWFDNDK